MGARLAGNNTQPVGARLAGDCTQRVGARLAGDNFWTDQRIIQKHQRPNVPQTYPMQTAAIPSKGYKELRKGRYSERNRIYHVTTKTHQRQRIFSHFGDAPILINAFRVQHGAGHLASLAFVVMPDHMHWMVQLLGERSLPTCVNLVKSLATREIHRDGFHRGNIWQRGFQERALRKDDDLVAVARYIVANPVRAGLVRSVREYPHWYAKWV